jgi:hypothetical protein
LEGAVGLRRSLVRDQPIGVARLVVVGRVQHGVAGDEVAQLRSWRGARPAA